MLRAREVLERRSELLVRDDPEIGREAVCQSDGRLRLARADHLRHAELVAKGFRKSGRVWRRGHKVDVADDFLTAPETPCDLDRPSQARLSQLRDHLFG